jgi:hypothetical protein
LKSRCVPVSKFETPPVICPAPLIPSADAPKALQSAHAAGSTWTAPADQ